nr:hypothetical protein GCM10020092_034350 [Actinoplanes digitatis]
MSEPRRVGRRCGRSTTRPAGSSRRPWLGSASTTVQRGFAYGPDGFLSAVTDSALGTRTVALDQVGRVNAVTGASWRETYAYDTA